MGELRIGRMARVLALALLCLVTLEICARVDDALRYGAALTGPYTSERLRSVDTDGLQFNVPSVRFEKWIHNRQGFRGPEIDVVPASGARRVAVMGTSESYGLYEDADMEWPAQLRQQLSAVAGVEVLNASIVGLAPAKYVEYLRKYVMKFRPDLVVVLINPYAFATGAVTGNNPAPVAAVRPRGAAARVKALLSSSRVYPKIRMAGKQVLPAALVRRYLLDRSERRIWAEAARRLHGVAPLDSVPRAVLTAYDAELSAIVSYLEGQGTGIILSTYPTLLTPENLAVEREVVLNERRYFVEFSEQGMLDIPAKLNAVTRSFATRRRLPLVDSATVIAQTRENFADGVHLTNIGATRMATGIAAAVTATLGRGANPGRSRTSGS